MLWRSAAVVAVQLTAVLGAAYATAADSARPATPASQTPDDLVVAQIGSERLTVASVIDQNKNAFAKLQADHDRSLRRMQLRQDEERYNLVEEQTQKLLDEKALQLEAQARGTSEVEVLSDIRVPVVTDAEAKAFYESRKLRTQQSFEELRPDIVKYLADKHNSEATRRFYDELRVRHHITVALAPFRVSVDATGPTRGNAQAAVTIVEFGDFQCIYCREAESTLHAVMARYPDEVRVVFRNLPLGDVHPNAMTAAEAGVCADRQGKFWPMHDAMYDDQSALTEPALKETAKRLGLDPNGFAACLSDPATKAAVQTDVNTANQLNLSSTPSFLINGRPLRGSLPLDRFESVISDELQRIHSRKSG